MRLEVDFSKLLDYPDLDYIALAVIGISCIYAIAAIVTMLFLKGSK
jgi:hypothetical protein